MDRDVKKQLQQYIQIFQDGRQRGINEADTVMYLVKFFTDVLGYDLFSEITKEFQIRERYCDIAVKIDGQVKFLVEAKAIPLNLSDRHIEQAENYAARSGISWVVLTNGITWRLYHLTFDQGGIEHDLAFEVNLTPETDLEELWECLGLLARESLAGEALAEFWEQKKALCPDSLVRALFTEEVINAIRRELRRKSEVKLEMSDVASSLRRLMNPEVLTENIKVRKARKKKRRPVESPTAGEDNTECAAKEGAPVQGTSGADQGG